MTPDRPTRGAAAEFEALFSYLETIRPLPADARSRLSPYLRLERLKKGGYFVRLGQVPLTVGFLVEGWLRHVHIDSEGREYIRYFCSGGNLVSSQSALVEGRASEYSIQAVEPCRLIVFAYRDWLAISQSHPVWAAIHQTVLERALDQSERRERSLMLEDAAARYRRFLEEYPGAEQHLRQYDIASYLGLSPVSLSRIRRHINIGK